MRNFDFKRLLFLSFGILLSACNEKGDSKAAVQQGTIIAWVGDEAITEEELLKALRQRGVAQPSEEAKQEMLSQLVEARRLFLDGKENGWHSDEEAKLAARRNVVLRVQRDFEQSFDSLTPPSKEEILAYYEEKSADFRTQAAALGAIVLRTEDPETARKILTQFLENNQLPEDGTFGALAAEYSHDPTTRITEGRMRWVTPSQRQTSRWPAPVFDALFALKEKGELSPVTLLPEGAFIVRLVEKHPSEPIPLKRVSAEISALIFEAKRVALKEGFEEQLERKYPVRYEK